MQKGFAIPLILVGMLVVGLVIGGAIYLSRSTIPKQSSTQVTSPSPAADASRESTDSAETTNWKTYRNNELKIEFKYPTNMNLKINQSFSAINPNNIVTVINLTDGNSSINLNFEPNPKMLSADEWLVERRQDEEKCELDCYGFSSSAEQITFAKKKGLIQSLGSVIGTIDVYLPTNKDSILWASASTYKQIGPTEDTKKLLLSILDTVKFLE